MDDLRNTIKGFIPIMSVMLILGMLRSLLTIDIEKRLGRKLTDLEYQYFLLEQDRKAAADARDTVIRQWRQQMDGMQKIHDFVWNGG